LEQDHRPTLAPHVHRTAPMGPCVLISEGWYYGFLKWELQNTHKSSISGLKNIQGVENKMLVFEERFEGAGVKNYASRNRYMREAERAYDAAQSAPASPKPSPPMNFPPMGRGIGSFDVNALGAAPPLGSSTVNNGSTVTMNHNTTVKIDAGGDPA
ncbi:hypothetical protein, partial [Methylobacterium sp. Leaf88]|uniref:hypothetical protein n=1 Tax=Methylobacterium sp. Leaf88 TaxID=1736244 RepID=UPI001AEC3FDC